VRQEKRNIADILKIAESNKTKKNNTVDVDELERKLELERARSSFWKCKANGENPVILGSRESIEYIMS